MCTRASANALYSDCSSESDFIYCQANDHSQESKQPRCLIRFGRRCVFAQGCLVDKVFPHSRGTRKQTWNKMGTYKCRSAEGCGGICCMF